MRKELYFVATVVAAGGLGLAGCGDDPETIIDLTVIETMPVDFGAMQAGVIESALHQLDDLRDEKAYADAQGKLKCASIDLTQSALVVERLQVAAGATVAEYVVSIGARGAANYTELARYSGSLASGDEVALDSPKFTLSSAGLTALSSIVLGATPAMDVQITASVPGGVDALQLALELAIVFSSDPKGCPTAR